MHAITLSLGLFLSGLLLAPTGLFAQDARTLLQFEDAEKAFNAGQYETTLQQLDAVEKQTGVTSKTLYLRIVSEYRLFDGGSRIYEDKKQFERLQRIRKHATQYLNALAGQGIDDKYRAIYEISESVQTFPKTEQQWSDTIRSLKEQQRRLAEKAKREKQKAEDELYAKVVTDQSERTALSYIQQYPQGTHIKAVERIYADALYTKGAVSLNKKNYAAAQGYFNTYMAKFPSGDKIAEINSNKAILATGLKRQRMLNKWDDLDCYVMASYATDGNFGVEFGGMDVSQRINVFIAAEGTKPADVVFGTPEKDPIGTSGMLAARAKGLPWLRVKCAAWRKKAPMLRAKSKSSSTSASPASKLAHSWWGKPVTGCRISSPRFTR